MLLSSFYSRSNEKIFSWEDKHYMHMYSKLAYCRTCCREKKRLHVALNLQQQASLTLRNRFKTSDKDGDMESLRDVSPSQGLLQSAICEIADWRSPWEGETSLKTSHIPVFVWCFETSCFLFWTYLINRYFKKKKNTSESMLTAKFDKTAYETEERSLKID